MALKQKTNYEWLRSAYDLAFAQLATETQQLYHLHTQKAVKTGTITQAEQKVADAERVYLQTRNALADFLIAKQSQSTLVPSLSPAFPNEQKAASIEECAYFLWVNAGSPSGNDLANWYRAESGSFRR